jgi:hypothetical protein
MDLQERIREAILAIDEELKAVNDAEYRTVLVNAAYKLNELRLFLQIKKSAPEPATETSSSLV